MWLVRAGVRCVRVARVWAARVGGARGRVVGAIVLGSARGRVSEGVRLQVPRYGMGGSDAVLARRCGAGDACRALSPRRVVVLVSAVQGFWWESVFVVGKSWPCAWTVCHVSFMFSF